MSSIGMPAPISSAPARAHLFRRLLRSPLGLIPMIVLAMIAIIAIIGPLLAPLDPNYSDLSAILLPPSPEHLLGTDNAGRDVLSRLLTATQLSIAAALVALVTALVLGVAAGLFAGYYGGVISGAAAWVTALLMALPGIVVLLAARAVMGPSVWLAMLTFGILMTPAFYMLVSTSVRAVRKELYIDAARVSGLSDTRIIGRHVLSVVRAPIIIQSGIILGVAIAVQSGLEFLGMGDPQSATWGSMLSEAFSSIYRAPLLMLWPALAIAVTTIALTLLANALRDELERIPVVRRRRQRAVTTASGSIATATTSVSLLASDGAPSDELADVISAEETIVHPDDAQSALVAAEPLLRIRGLRVGYDQSDGSNIEVVRSVSLDIRRGEVHGLIGESGSGKSQTAFSVLGLLPPGGRVLGGSIELDGIELAGADEKTYSGIRGTRIGYIPQEPMSNLDPSFTIGSQLTEPLRVVLGMSARDAKHRALDLLARVGISDPARTMAAYPFEISGGMIQRVLIAGAISTNPELIVADEPSTALDVTVQAEVLDLLRGLQREQGMAMLLVTHNFGVVADLCDRVTVMQRGVFVEQGPVRTILRSPSHPYTRSLLDAILDGGPARAPLVAGVHG